MKKFIFLSVVLVSAICFSQEDSKQSNFKCHAITLGIPFLSGYSSSNTGGLDFNGSLAYSYNKHLFSVELSIATEFAILGGFDERVNQYNILYGREFKASRTVFFELHGGAGLFSYRSQDVDPNQFGSERIHTVGFPLKMKFRVHTGPRFSIGLQGGVNINPEQIIRQLGLFIQWNTKKW